MTVLDRRELLATDIRDKKEELRRLIQTARDAGHTDACINAMTTHEPGMRAWANLPLQSRADLLSARIEDMASLAERPCCYGR